MSAIATGWTFARSPFVGQRLLVHLAVADVADDMHGHIFHVTIRALAEKARASERTVQNVLRDMEDHDPPLVELVEAGGGRGRPATYRFLMPATERVQDVHPLERVQTQEYESSPLVTERTTQELARAPFPVAPIRPPAPRPVKARETGPGGRPRNPIWDAVAEVCGPGWGTDLPASARGRMAKAVREIEKVTADPAEVKRRASVYRTKYRGCDLTPTALASNWPSLGSVGDVPADYNPATAWMYQ